MDNSKLQNINKEIDETKHLLQHNCEKVIERGEHLDQLDSRAAVLSLSSVNFKKKSKKLKNRLCCNSYLPYIIISVILIVILIIIITSRKQI